MLKARPRPSTRSTRRVLAIARRIGASAEAAPATGHPASDDYGGILGQFAQIRVCGPAQRAAGPGRCRAPAAARRRD